MERSLDDVPAAHDALEATPTRVECGFEPSMRVSHEFNSLDPGNIRLDQIGGLIFSIVASIAILVGLVVLWFNIGWCLILWVAMAVGLLAIVASFVGALLWPALVHKHASWRLDKLGLEIRRGVLWRHRITIPLGRVQHADVSQGPLQRLFAIGTLTVHTAGTQNASVGLDGIAHETAIELRDKLVDQRKGQNVV
jgi:membrane protein YdbS with pleckstrin-like domain